jgi:hypothetical protein
MERKNYNVFATYEGVEFAMEINAISEISAIEKTIRTISENWKVDFKTVCDYVYNNNYIDAKEIQKDLTTF